MDIVKLFEENVHARKRLAELLISELNIRLAIINAVIRDVATKSDIEKLRKEFRREIEKLREEFREEVSKLEKRIDDLEERVAGLEIRVFELENLLFS